MRTDTRQARRSRLWITLLLAASTSMVRAQDLDTETHATGFVRDDPARYQAIPAVQAFRAFYPPRWDLAADLPTPGNQGKQGSCVAWAVGYAARTYYLKHDYGVDVSQAANILSPAFIYNSLRETRGDCSSGTSVSDALKLLQQSGGVPLAQLPYDPNQCLALPAPAILAQYSDRFRIRGYRRVEGKDADDIKGQLYSGNPVIFAIDIPEGFERYKGGLIDSTEDRGLAFGHALVLVGYDDARQAYHFVNSWGTRWGEGGYGWLSYRAAAALWQGGYVMDVAPPPHSAPAPAPEPVPSPPPAPPAAAPSLSWQAPCSQLRAQATASARGFEFALSGFIDSSEHLEQLRQSALAQPGVSAVEDRAVSIRPWPQCEALLTLDAALHHPNGLQIKGIPERERLLRGEHMVFEIQSPDFPSYLYVAYLQADGTAAHLLRPQDANPTAANTRLRLGDTPGVPRYRVGPPYGHEMVIALAADHPLLDPELQGPVRERQLLSAYRRLLLDDTTPRASAAVLMLETAEQ